MEKKKKKVRGLNRKQKTSTMTNQAVCLDSLFAKKLFGEALKKLYISK